MSNRLSSNESFINYDKNILSKKIKETHLLQQADTDIKRSLRSSFVNINSANRSKAYTFQYYSSTDLIANPIKFSGTNNVIIYHPDNNLDVTKAYNIILTGIVAK